MSFPRYIPLKDCFEPPRQESEVRMMVKVLAVMSAALFLIWGLQSLGYGATTKRATSLSGEAIARAAKDTIVRYWKDAGFEASATLLRFPSDILLTGNAVSFRVRPIETVGPVGNVGVPVDIFDGERPLQGILVAMHVAVYATVAVTARTVLPHERITEADVQWNRLALRALPSSYIQRPEELQGKRAAQTVPQGTPLARRWIQDDPLVKKGSEIDVVSAEGPIVVSLRGVAEKDGLAAELVPVRNPDTGKRFNARVIDATHFEWAGSLP